MWLRGLIAVTCIAVLAAVGYFFWAEYQQAAHQSRQDEIATARQDCLFMLDRYANRGIDNPNADAMLEAVNDCIEKLLITEGDINAAIAGRGAAR